jgi:4-hydroxybenzoate polyprenyltransferase
MISATSPTNAPLMNKGAPAPPLAVDLDGTLIKADTLHEGVIGCLKAQPLAVFEFRAALRNGKAALKRAIANHGAFDPSLLPYNVELVEFLKAEKRAGRQIGLFTAADQSIADKVAAYLGFFDVVRGSDGVTNLSGPAKLAAIRETFGERFAYAGDGLVDKPIFDGAESIIVVGRVERLKASLGDSAKIEAVYPISRASLGTWAKALRLQHWIKNALVFVPPILGFQSASPAVAVQAVLLFLLFGLLASATYLLNDLLDLTADRAHPHKRFRALAAGVIPARDGVLVAALLIAGALACGLVLPWGCFATLLAYLAITLSYSLLLKQMPIMDVVILAALFTLRVLAGSFLLAAPVSPWLLTFSLLFFLSLAIIKRYAELDRIERSGVIKVAARGYKQQDLTLLISAGVASGFSAIVIFMIYLINEQYPRNFYTNPGALWGIMPVLLIWTLRAWHLSVHGRMSEDPVVFALKDRFSLALGGIVALILIVAWS